MVKRLTLALLAAGCTAGLGTIAASSTLLAGAALAAIAALAVLVTRPPLLAILACAAVFGGARVPVIGGVGSSTDSGLVSYSDAFLILSALGILWRPPTFTPMLRRVIYLAVAYEAVMLLPLVHNMTQSGVGEWAHRGFLVIVSVLIGAYLQERRMIRPAILVFFAAAVLISCVAVFDTITTGFAAAYPLGEQKNYDGDLLAGGLILLLVLPRSAMGLGAAHRVALGVTLAAGLAATQSRASMIAVGLAALILGGLRFRAASSRALLILCGVAVLAGVALQIRSQLATETPAISAFGLVTTRQVYATQALTVFQSSPLLGAGIRFYAQPNALLTGDPHDVLALSLSESGIVGLMALLALVGGAALIAVRLGTDLGIAALLLIVGRFTHGLFDIYWVHGSQSLQWIVLGMAVAAAARGAEVADGRAGVGQPEGVRSRRVSSMGHRGPRWLTQE